MDDGVEALVLAYEDAAVETAMDAVAGFEHGTPAGESMVEGFLAQGAGRIGIQTRHLACMLLALDEGDGVIACRDEAVGVFEGVANLFTVDEEVAVGVFALGFGSR